MAFMKMVWQTDDSTFRVNVVARIKDSTPRIMNVHVRAKIKDSTPKTMNVHVNAKVRNS